ncbi:DUF4300 family protein [Corynebacterium propinquum]|uniref:DUF4300 family protein n=1 Tax=Corynebacterium propinquum TaxID=43769 RepID=A0AAP4BUV8_9CORY|nr:DUF4300 family protein [Corynebacterium propinquum]MDK4326825.1 DUF4300 family protein [Corynebacterium propinquum]MDK8665726.1 DUF4300 family protein [Corynebacterium propinquum]MDK8722320.1 DUF4300 family protein [Corynebacterium propinquum]UQV60848.1 DUF4300 family protein [Corynebacterium propinquum]
MRTKLFLASSLTTVLLLAACAGPDSSSERPATTESNGTAESTGATRTTGASSAEAAPAHSSSDTQQSRFPTAENDAAELLEGMTVSNLVDKKSQDIAHKALTDADVPQESIDGFFRLVDEFNHAVPTDSLINDGFTNYGTQDPDYDVEAITTAWQQHHANYAGTNCRINTFTLADSLFTVDDQDNPNESLLFIDQESLNNAPGEILDEQERRKFAAFYSNIPTTSALNPSQHIADIQAHFDERGIEFADTDARVISMFSHDTLTEPATLFIGHTGVAVPLDDGYLFLEKIAFDMPYQAITVRDMQQLNDYLMHKYDDGPGLEYGRPIIFDNDEVIDGMRFARR